jgi:hypothetical protein
LSRNNGTPIFTIIKRIDERLPVSLVAWRLCIAFRCRPHVSQHFVLGCGPFLSDKKTPDFDSRNCLDIVVTGSGEREGFR